MFCHRSGGTNLLSVHREIGLEIKGFALEEEERIQRNARAIECSEKEAKWSLRSEKREF